MSSGMNSQRRAVLLGVSCALAVGLVVGRFVARARQGATVATAPRAHPDAPPRGTRFQIPISDSQPSRGPATALVTIVEWSDVRCSRCAAAEALVEAARQQYGDALRVVWRNQVQTSVPDALGAADFAMEAHTEAGKFWQALALLRSHAGALSEADLLGFGKQLGLDERGVRQALEQQSHRVHIVNDGVFAERFGVRELPAFFINGVPFTGPLTADGLKAAIEPELTRARGLVAGGVAPENVYAELTKGGLWNVPDWKNPALAR